MIVDLLENQPFYGKAAKLARAFDHLRKMLADPLADGRFPLEGEESTRSSALIGRAIRRRRAWRPTGGISTCNTC